MSTTIGLYVQRYAESGEIHTVQVRDSAGGEYPWEPTIYLQRGCKPPIGSLPELSEYLAKQQSNSERMDGVMDKDSPSIEAIFQIFRGHQIEAGEFVDLRRKLTHFAA